MVPDLSYQSTCTWNSLSADQHFFVGFLCKVLWGSGFAHLLLWELYFSVMGFQRMLLPHHVFCVLFTENFLWCFYQVFSVLLRVLCGVLWPVFSVLLKFICGVYVVFVLLRILCHVSATCILCVTEHSLWHFSNMFLCYWGIFVVFCPMCVFVSVTHWWGLWTKTCHKSTEKTETVQQGFWNQCVCVCVC